MAALDDDALQRLKAAFDAGYYRRESAEDGEPGRFPWQSKTCKDCPFWKEQLTSGYCRVHLETRSAGSPTCRFFDPCNRQEAEAKIKTDYAKGWQSGQQSL